MAQRSINRVDEWAVVLPGPFSSGKSQRLQPRFGGASFMRVELRLERHFMKPLLPKYSET
jgi:hypothetical protein